MELTREQILEADDMKIREVDVPEWGGITYIRTLSTKAYAEYIKTIVNDDGEPRKDNYIAKYCAFVICDSKGELLFAIEDVGALGKKYSAVMARIFDEAKKLNGEDIGELVKNLRPTQSDSSDSD